MANEFAAFAQLLRFVAQKTERVDADVGDFGIAAATAFDIVAHADAAQLAA